MSGLQSQGVTVPTGQQLRFKKSGVKVQPNPNTAALRPEEPGLLKDHNLRFAFARWNPTTLTAFRLILLIRFCAAMYTSISDCDEVFNYWDPLHYLVHGKGFQTWEYSPEFSIRSYFYLLIHAGPAYTLKLLGFEDKRVAFFATRIMLASFCSFIEAVFYRAAALHLSSHVGRYVLWISMFSAAMYSASAAFLPSSFALYFVMIGTAASLSPVQSGWKRITFATSAYAVAGIVGWPFSVLLGVPMIVEHLCVRGTLEKVLPNQTAAWTQKRARGLFIALAVGSIVAVPVVLVDSAAYQKFAIVPLNLIRYNLFPTQGAGPELYGTESWYFYLLNGLINFNILFPLAFLSLPALWLTTIYDPKRFGDLRDRLPGQTSPATSLAIRLAPTYLYVAVLTLQRHKEERFLFPAYGNIILNAAITIYLARGLFEQAFIKVTKSPYRATRSGIFSHATRAVIVVSCLISFGRISAIHKYYHAPFNVYHHLQMYELTRLTLAHHPEIAPAIDAALPLKEFAVALDKSRAISLESLADKNLRLCLGKEWHRFPSSWLVPDQLETRFIKSEFDGILPKQWEAPGEGKGLFGRATAVVPTGMNMFNQEEHDRYVDVSTCDYLVDLEYPERPESSLSPLEPRYSLDSSTWDKVYSHPYLDATNSPMYSRAINLPIPGWASKNSWGEYTLLRRKGVMPDSGKVTRE
ncbi:dolichyl-P-Man:Man(6)GlcNAc(2)-PP-dolichol alpha-1,2-mannosyltransferase [Sporobolomyces koalae]|uniref:dolichyl-P-Man:Man(6)GlcNAc(2)-PP-dolichol alpha-1,2-mannosyltransferase n=1 Tax=Sporobolomyces koalae TaxID=500713 RepID=UPI0031720926